MRSADRDRLTGLMHAMGAYEPRSWVALTVPGVPGIKPRPRRGRHGNVYTPAAALAREHRDGWLIREVMPEPLRGNLAMALIFHRPDRRLCDVDNMLKHILDAANGVAYLDDSQLTGTVALVELDRLEPRTALMIGPHYSTLDRT